MRSGPAPRALPIAVTGVVLAALAAFLLAHREHILTSVSLHPRAILAIAGLTLAGQALRALENRQVFGRLGARAPLRDWLGLALVNSFANHLPISTGVAAKAFFLKRVHALPYRVFAAGQGALLLLVLAANGAVGLAALAAMPAQPRSAAALVFALMLAPAALLLLPRNRLPAALTPALASRRAAPAVAACQVAIVLLTALSLQIAFAMAGRQVGLVPCVVLSAASVVTSLVSITPGAIGVREFLIGGLALLTGLELRDAVLASTLARLGEAIPVFGLGGAFAYSLSRRVAATYADEERG